MYSLKYVSLMILFMIPTVALGKTEAPRQIHCKLSIDDYTNLQSDMKDFLHYCVSAPTSAPCFKAKKVWDNEFYEYVIINAGAIDKYPGGTDEIKPVKTSYKGQEVLFIIESKKGSKV